MSVAGALLHVRQCRRTRLAAQWRGSLTAQELLDITPSPRILQVLGDIEFDHWQCIAELVDNGFDEFLEIKRVDPNWAEPLHVTIIAPSAGEVEPTLEVRDNGRGIEIETIRNAVRAGFSGNNPFDKLGLFGMGFNISTARLGNVARVLSKRAGEAEWRGVEIDLLAIGQLGQFKVPVISEPADDPTEHGTRVVVSKLKPDPRDYFTRAQNLGRLRTKLGDVYSHLLEREGFNLYVSGQPARPRRACVWDASRSVTRRRYGSVETIPAVITIDHPLSDMAACGNCRHWQPPGQPQCATCGSKDLSVRSRAITGWLGIQRYTHTSDFGVDFMRNGRKILLRDKRLFEWQDPEADSGPVREYPVEVPYEGRIAGEIHIDHVPVNYQKNAFEYDGQAWRAVVLALRGEGPLLLKKRSDHGYNASNDSPLARLFDGFRRNDPGLNYLVPGNGRAALKHKAVEWAQACRAGDPDYQGDEKWYAAAKQHDELVEQAKLVGVGVGGQQDPGGVLDDMGLGGATSSGSNPGADPAAPAAGNSQAAPETEQERQERFKSGGEELVDLSTEYSLPAVGNIKVTVYLVRGTRVTTPDGAIAPVYLSRRSGGAYYAFIDEQSPIFSAFGADVADLLLAEIASLLKIRSSSAEPLSKLVGDLKSRHLPDRKLDPQSLGAAARDLLATITDRLADCVDTVDASVIWSGLSEPERSHVVVQATMARETLANPGEDGEFLRHLPAMMVARIVERFPAAILNGTVLAPNYAALSAENTEARLILKERTISHLTDVAFLAGMAGSPSVAELRRGQYSIELAGQLVSGAQQAIRAAG